MPKTELPTWGEIFTKASAEMRERGWFQGWFIDHPERSGAVCSGGAINLALGHPADCRYPAALIEAFDILIDHDPKLDAFMDLFHWNDSKGQTEHKVLKAFDAASSDETRVLKVYLP